MQRIERKIPVLGMQFIEQRYPQEAEMFQIVWSVLRHKRQENPRERNLSFDGLAGGLPFAGKGDGGIVSPYVVLTLDAVFRELAATGVTPDISVIGDVIEHAATKFGATGKLVNELVTDLAPRLRETFQDLRSEDLPLGDEAGTASHQISGILAVEWCDEVCSQYEKSLVRAQSFPPGETDERFVENKNRYALFVDERSSCIEARPALANWGDEQYLIRVAWKRLASRHRVALGCFLTACRLGRPIAYTDIMGDPGLGSHKPAQRAKSYLDKKLGGVLSEFVRSVPNSSQYEVHQLIPYCWIRTADGPSRLLR